MVPRWYNFLSLGDLCMVIMNIYRKWFIIYLAKTVTFHDNEDTDLVALDLYCVDAFVDYLRMKVFLF